MNTHGFIIIVLAFFMTLPASAQWGLGLSGGCAYNHYDYDPQYMTGMHYEGHFGGVCGLHACYQFNNKLSLLGGATLQQRGYNLDFRHHDSVTIHKYRRDDFYICFPLMAEFSFGQSKWQGFVDVGAYAGYWLKSRYGTKMYLSYLSHSMCFHGYYYTEKEFSADRDQRFEFGVIGGLGTFHIICSY